MTSPSLPVHDQLAGPGHQGRLDLQQFTADLGPGQPGRQPDLILLLGQPVPVLRGAEIAENGLGVDPVFLGLQVLLETIARHLATQAGDAALEVPDTGLTGVAADDLEDRPVGELNVAGLETVLLQLFRYQEAFGDLQLFLPRYNR